MEEKLNELGGLDGKKSAKVALKTQDGGEFWVKEMSGREWLSTIGELGESVWENAALPENYWNKDQNYNQSNIHVPPLFAGVSDGVVEEVSNYPQLIKLGYDVASKKEVREGLWNSVKNISTESIKNAATDFYEEKKNNYTSDKSYIVNHTVGKDAVQVASILMGGGAIKSLKNTTDNIHNGVKKVGEEIKKVKVKKIFNSAQEFAEDIVKNKTNIRKNILDLAETKDYARKYFDTVVKEGDFDDWFKNNFSKYEKGTLNFEAHHIIPIDVLKTNPDLQQLLFDLKKADPNFSFDFNGIDNGMMLQKKSLKLDVNGHTIHNDYSREINKKITEIITSPRNLNKPEKAFEEIQELIKNTKNKLEKEVLLGNKDVNDIIDF